MSESGYLACTSLFKGILEGVNYNTEGGVGRVGMLRNEIVVLGSMTTTRAGVPSSCATDLSGMGLHSRRFFCFYSCSPPLTLPPELSGLSNQ